VGSFGEGIFQGVSGGGTRKRENINDRKQETRTGPSQAKSKILQYTQTLIKPL